MAETTSSPAAPAESSPPEYWCYHCNKRVAVDTLPDVVCHDCKNGFVELIHHSDPPSRPVDPDNSPFLQVLRLIAQAARAEDSPPPLPHNPSSADAAEEDFLRIELDGWDNDDDDDDEDEEEEEDDDDADARSVEFHGGEENEEPEADAEEGGEEEEEDRSDQLQRDDGDEEEEGEEDMRRRRREVLRLRIRDIATQARSGRNRILDWAEILMGLEDNSIELRFEVPESDRYVGNPEDYVDAAGYEALLQNLAESDGSGRRGAPPASKAAVAELQAVEITTVDEAEACAICKEMVSVGEMSTKLPCGHGYHGDCIVPWLSSRNSCPVCRFELPTDDPEYEEERKKLNVSVASGAAAAAADDAGAASGSGGGNSVSG